MLIIIISTEAEDRKKDHLKIFRACHWFVFRCTAHRNHRNRLSVRWKCPRWLVTHMTHLYFKKAHHTPGLPGGWENNHRWILVHTQVEHLITNLIGLCQVTGAVILRSSGFRKALWYICFKAETDSLSDQQAHFMINYIQCEVKIMRPPKCKH